MTAAFQAAAGGLWHAAGELAAAEQPAIGLITGFYVPGGMPPAAETDGPAGAALLARAFTQAGVPCRLATDADCRSACEAALRAAGAGVVPVDAAPPHADLTHLLDTWRRAGINRVIAIERCGPSPDGVPRNMRGLDISAHAAPLDGLFSAGPWRTIGIGDGGNELGMGRLPRDLLARHIPLGETVGCMVPADSLVAAGVSHWGAYALMAALALLRPGWAAAMRGSLDPALDQAVVEAMVRDGPAVDGVSLERAVTIDALPMDAHHAVLREILAAMEK
jgi:hypothetical protein